MFRKDYSFLAQLSGSRDFLQKILRYNTRSPHLVQLTHLCEGAQADRLCSDVNRVVACFEFLPQTLRRLVLERGGRPFPEPRRKLWAK